MPERMARATSSMPCHMTHQRRLQDAPIKQQQGIALKHAAPPAPCPAEPAHGRGYCSDPSPMDRQGIALKHVNSFCGRWTEEMPCWAACPAIKPCTRCPWAIATAQAGMPLEPEAPVPRCAALHTPHDTAPFGATAGRLADRQRHDTLGHERRARWGVRPGNGVPETSRACAMHWGF